MLCPPTLFPETLAFCVFVKVKASELKEAVANAVKAQCPFLGALTDREKEIVAYMDLVHPLPSSGPCFEEVLDVSGPQSGHLQQVDGQFR